MARRADHQLHCLGWCVVGHRRFGGRCWPSHNEQRSVPSHNAVPDQRQCSDLVLRAITTQSKVKIKLRLNACGDVHKADCSCSRLACFDYFKRLYNVFFVEVLTTPPPHSGRMVGKPSLIPIREELPVILPQRQCSRPPRSRLLDRLALRGSTCGLPKIRFRPVYSCSWNPTKTS